MNMATDERIAKYEDKMNKTMDALVKELGTIRADVQIRIFWIKSP